MDASHFFSALQQQQRVPLVTPEQLEAQTRKTRDRLTVAIVQLNKELHSMENQKESLRAQLSREEAAVLDLEEELQNSRLKKDKLSRTLSRMTVERTELEAEAALEDKRIAALKEEIHGMRIDRESLSRSMIEEKNALHAARIGTQRRMKEALEEEERELVNEIVQLRASVDQGRMIKGAKLEQLRSIIE